MYETERDAGRLFLHEHPWDASSRGLNFFNEIAERDGVVKAIGSMEVLELDEYVDELQNVFDSISGVRLDPELLRALRKVSSQRNG